MTAGSSSMSRTRHPARRPAGSPNLGRREPSGAEGRASAAPISARIRLDPLLPPLHGAFAGLEAPLTLPTVDDDFDVRVGGEGLLEALGVRRPIPGHDQKNRTVDEAAHESGLASGRRLQLRALVARGRRGLDLGQQGQQAGHGVPGLGAQLGTIVRRGR